MDILALRQSSLGSVPRQTKSGQKRSHRLSYFNTVGGKRVPGTGQ